MNPNVKHKYPIYVISKGRAKTPLTIRALQKTGAEFRVVVEPQEQREYEAVVPRSQLLILPFSNLGQGSIPARNWVWEHSLSEGHARHWIMDDNIRDFYRLNKNRRIRVYTTAIFKAAEDFTDRYKNIALSGLQYKMFCPDSQKRPPFLFNTRIYSCILINNKLTFRWRGRYNEDTDLSLRVLKSGYCTILFNAFLCDKIATMTMKGGNTDELYKQNDQFDGRLEMAKSLQQQHPDVVRITRKWGRWQHVVDYRPFKRNKLIRRLDLSVPKGIDNYGMRLQD